MARVIHTGDTHLGYQQYHEPERREDFLAAFRQVARDAVEADVDAVIHAGDLFHDRRPTLQDVMGALSVLRILDDGDVPFLAIVGNHEAKRSAQWLDLFESLGLATRLGSEPVTIDNTAVYGLDFVPRSKREDLAYDFEDHDAEFAALVSHGLFEPFPHGDWDARTVLGESTVDFDAMLLGDDHEPQTKHIDEPQDAWLTYCGSTERASAAERAERGYNLVEFEEPGGVDVRRRGLNTREFVFVDLDLEPGEGLDRVRDRVGQHDLEETVVVVSIEGEGDPVQAAVVEEFATERGALVARVTDHREIGGEEETLDVSFADPDDAVAERIRELGLSQAARELDETIRASKVPDSSVDDRVEERVRELVEEGDPGVFEPAPEGADGETSPVDGETSPVDGETSPADANDDGDVSVDAETAESEATESETAEAAGQRTEGGTESAADDAPAAETEDQATMEEYL